MARANKTPRSEVPEGEKIVRRTTQEEYRAPLDEPKNVDDLTIEPDVDDTDEPEDVELTQTQKFLATFRESVADGGIRVTAIRKPDPVGISFRNPSSVEYTAGDVPYDEADLSVEALEVTIQKLYDGGRYQIKVRQNGKYQGSITRNIRDLPESERLNNQSSAMQPQAGPHTTPVVEQRNDLDGLRGSLGLLREFGLLPSLGDKSEPLPQQSSQPMNPMDAVREAIGVFKDVRSEVVGDIPAGGQHNTVDSVANLLSALKIGDLLLEGGKIIIPHIPSIINALNARAQAQRKAADRNGGTAEGAADSPRGSNSSQAALPPHSPQGPGGGVNEVGTSTAPPAQEDSAPMPSPEEMKVLGFVVEQIRAYDQEESNENYQNFLDACAEQVRTLPPQTMMMLAGATPLELLIVLTQLREDWADLANVKCAMEFVHDLKADLFQAPEEPVTDVVREFPKPVVTEEVKDAASTEAPKAG